MQEEPHLAPVMRSHRFGRGVGAGFCLSSSPVCQPDGLRDELARGPSCFLSQRGPGAGSTAGSAGDQRVGETSV